jgi:uncharacterized protein (TIGR04141 family)
MDGTAMSKVDPPLQALTIFLIRELFDLKKIVKKTNLHKIDLGAHGTLHIKRPRNKLPTWTDFFKGHVNPEEFGHVKSAAAVLLTIVDGRHFAVVFGNGRYLLNQLAIEQRFGLLVTLNAVDPKKIRSIDKAKLDRQGIQSRTQASRDASANDFGLDFDADLIKAVAGTPIHAKVGETIAGFDSLHVATRISFDDLRAQLALYLKKSNEKTYQQEFRWVDQVSEVRDADLSGRLYSALIKGVKAKQPVQCWMAPDGIIDWNQVTWFQFGTGHSSPRVPQLTLDQLIDHVGGLKKLNPISLERCRIQALRADDSVAHEWPASHCLQAEIQYNQKLYLLNSGKWYLLDDDFVAAVNKVVSEIKVRNLGLLEYQDQSEGIYNERVADRSNHRFALLDADNVRHGGGPSQVEFCDLYSQDREMIHVKRYSGSSVLSHLFSQAAVSGQLFKSDADFRRKVNAKLPATHKIIDCDKPLEPGEYKVVIVIIGGPKSCVELPFFSRVTLKNSTTLLTALGYEVSVSHVALEATFALTASLREKRARAKRKTKRGRAAVTALRSPRSGTRSRATSP